MGKVVLVGGVELSTGVGSGSSLLSSLSLSGPGWGGRLLVSSDRLLVSSCRLLACNGGLLVSSCRLLACNGGLLVSSCRLLACNGGLLDSSCRPVRSGKLLVSSGVILVVSGRLLVSNGGLLVSGEERAVGKHCATSSLWSRHRKLITSYENVLNWGFALSWSQSR